jgi:acyl carrier protein
MGKSELTTSELTDALIAAVRRVVQPDVDISANTPLDQTTLDSLGLIEVLVHLEGAVALALDDSTVRRVALDPDYDPSMTVAAFAELLAQYSGQTGGAGV